jgi:transposase
VVGLEACATAHYWARELGALGHEVRLMPAQYVEAHRQHRRPARDPQRKTVMLRAGTSQGVRIR